MFLFLVTICMAMVGQLSMAVPLESPISDDDLSSVMHLDSLLLDDDSSSAMQIESLQSILRLESPSPDKVLPSMLLESSLSDDAPSSAVLIESPTSALLQESSSADLSQYFDSRIVGGIDAPPGSTPHMVALVVGWQWKFFTCGASIISCKVIATAAHCIPLDWHGNVIDSFHAIVGTNTWNRGGTVVKIKSYVNHPQYDPIAIKNDIGLLITTVKLEFGKNVRPISLEHNWVGGGVKSYVTGWGTQTLWGAVPDKLQILFIKTISPKTCKKMIKIIGDIWAPPVDFELEICTYHSIGHGMCHGDSGSALVDYVTRKQIGLVSWGWPCAVGAPDMFVRVSSMMWFIKSVIGNHHCK